MSNLYNIQYVKIKEESNINLSTVKIIGCGYDSDILNR